VRELHSLVHYGFYDPVVPNTIGTGQWTTDGDPFTGVQPSGYWANTTYTFDTSFGWCVVMYGGSVRNYVKTNTYYVWPVRGGQ
jgi:hypothetical protein